MIQRIQTVWLALAGACLAALFFVPNELVAVAPSGGNFYSSAAGPIMLGLATVATLGAIFLFSNRPQQLKITRLALLDTLLFVVVAALLAFVELKKAAGPAQMQFGWAVGLPVAAMMFQWLAFRAIKADDELVKSSDRLR